MPRFFFHLHCELNVPDDEGGEFDNLASARRYAVRAARGLAGEALKEHGRIDLCHRIDIEDAFSAVLASVSYSDVIVVEDQPAARPIVAMRSIGRSSG